jgi:hypothetical protein
VRADVGGGMSRPESIAGGRETTDLGRGYVSCNTARFQSRMRGAVRAFHQARVRGRVEGYYTEVR